MKGKGFTLIELMIVVAIIGILMSMAVPAYQQYVIKTRVMEGIHLATVAKLAVAEATLIRNELPPDQESTGYKSPGSTVNVQSIKISNQGIIIISYTRAAGDGTLLFTPTFERSGEISWRCNEGTLPLEYRPAGCRDKDYSA